MKILHPLKTMLAACLLLAFLSRPCLARVYGIPEIGAALALSGEWQAMDASMAKEQNDGILRARPNAPQRYLVGFTRGATVGTQYFWVIKMPNYKTPITPELFLQLVPNSGSPHYDPRLRGVVSDVRTTVPNGDAARVHTIFTITKSNIVCLQGFSDLESADAVFAEMEGIASTLNFREEDKLPQSWFDRIQQVMAGAK